MRLLTTSLLASLLLSLTACSSVEPAYLQPSGQAIDAPAATTEFSDYLSDSHQRIKSSLTAAPSPEGFLGGYNASSAADLRAPYELAPAAECQSDTALAGSGKAFLMIHGLTDSPYTLHNVADDLHGAYPCALIRSIVLPGHGTVPGDTLDMSHQQWQAAVRYGVGSFSADEASQLYLVGFSTGTSLIVDYLNQPNPDNRIAGAVLLSAAIQANSSMAFLAPYVRHLKSWMSVAQERDAARYESFSFNAGAEFYLLTKDMKQAANALQVPLLMAVSADDTTINAAAAREFFCYASESERKLLVWYESADKDVNARQAKQAELQCDGIQTISPASFDPQWQTLNVAHTAISGSPADPHYGFNGNYRHCRSYEDGSKEFNECQTNTADSVFGEDQSLLEKQGLLGERYFRRGTFNPDYANLIGRVICLADEQCEL